MFDGCTFGLFEVDGGDWSFTGLPGADLRRSVFRGGADARGGPDRAQALVIAAALGLIVRED